MLISVNNKARNYQASLISVDGKEFANTIYKHVGGTSVFKINIPTNTPKGIAILKVYDGETVSSFQLFIQYF